MEKEEKLIMRDYLEEVLDMRLELDDVEELFNDESFVQFLEKEIYL